MYTCDVCQYLHCRSSCIAISHSLKAIYSEIQAIPASVTSIDKILAMLKGYSLSFPRPTTCIQFISASARFQSFPIFLESFHKQTPFTIHKTEGDERQKNEMRNKPLWCFPSVWLNLSTDCEVLLFLSSSPVFAFSLHYNPKDCSVCASRIPAEERLPVYNMVIIKYFVKRE